MFKDGRSQKHLLCLLFAGSLTIAGKASAMPSNVILFVGDGMGAGQVASAAAFSGTPLSFEAFPYQGQVTTASAGSSVTDSAAAATAMATGHKVNNGVISMAYPGDGAVLQTVLEYASANGKRTGLVTTTSMTHATPAAFAAHEPSRTNSAEIAQDYLTETRPNVLLGGDGSMSGAAAAGYTVVDDAAELQSLDRDTTAMVSGQFAPGHMDYEVDRTATTSQPHLSEMTAAALDILASDPDGFFLMVEGGRIDHAAHSNDLARTVQETLEFSRAVQVARDWALGAAPLDTLILVTADHETGGLTLLGSNGIGVYPDVSWTTTGHTAANVGLYGWGANSWLVEPMMDNTDIYGVMMATPEVIPVPGAIGLTAIGIGCVVLMKRGRCGKASY